MRRGIVVAVAWIVVAGTTGLAFPVAAHPVVDHCWQPLDAWQDDPIDDCSTQAPTPAISFEYDAPVIEGPPDPDGWGGTFPYLFRGILVHECTPDNVAGEEMPVRECIRSGGMFWDACDSFQHWNLGGHPEGDVPCSWSRDTYNASDDGQSVDSDMPFDRLAVTFDCLTCVVERNIPFVLTTNSLDSDSYFGEGTGFGDGANDGACEYSTIGDFFHPWCQYDGGPGPREMESLLCGDTSGITRPASDEYGTGDGVWQQALSDEDYRTHHLDNDEVRAHPGVDGVAVFMLGPIHGRDGCPQTSAYTTVRGTVTVTAS